MIKKGAILLMGLPGSGKGTQAFRLAEQFPNLVHIDTSMEIRRRLNDPRYTDDPVVQEQKKVYEKGELNDPAWVISLLSERICHLAEEGKGVVFSGSPRTLYEAKALAPLLFEVFGKDRVVVIILGISEEEIRRRITNRLVCSNPDCRYPTSKTSGRTHCPKCGWPLMQRPLDRFQETITTRLKEYRERTLPTVGYLLSLVPAEMVDAEKSEDEIFAKVLEAVERLLR